MALKDRLWKFRILMCFEILQMEVLDINKIIYFVRYKNTFQTHLLGILAAQQASHWEAGAKAARNVEWLAREAQERW